MRAVGGAKIHSDWSASGGRLAYTRDNASTRLEFGESASGLNIKIFGDTASAYLEWLSASNELYIASGAKLVNDGTQTFNGAVSFTGSATTIGNASTDKLSFYGGTATVQQAFVASGTASVMAEALRDCLVNLGLMASA
jgi:hypothetical protein